MAPLPASRRCRAPVMFRIFARQIFAIARRFQLFSLRQPPSSRFRRLFAIIIDISRCHHSHCETDEILITPTLAISRYVRHISIADCVISRLRIVADTTPPPGHSHCRISFRCSAISGAAPRFRQLSTPPPCCHFLYACRRCSVLAD